MLFPRGHTINNAIISENFFILTAISVISLFRCPFSSVAHLHLPLKRVSAMRGRGRPPLLTTTTGNTGRGSGVKMLAFSTPESLSDWLKPRLPSDSFASWGVKPGTKTVHNLWLELSQGETSLCDESSNCDPSPSKVVDEQQQLLLRTVHVATVRIRNSSGALLVESHQLLSDGTIRHRRRPLSEKMKPGETVEDAATRAVLEELGPRNVRILPGTYEMRVEERASFSYPGLPARYILHSIDAEVDGLPEEGEFDTEEVGEGCDESQITGNMVTVKRHFWKWIYGGVDDSEDESCLSAV